MVLWECSEAILMFQGINKVVFGEANQTLVAIVSAHGERVQLSKPVRIVPQVEVRHYQGT